MVEVPSKAAGEPKLWRPSRRSLRPTDSLRFNGGGAGVRGILGSGGRRAAARNPDRPDPTGWFRYGLNDVAYHLTHRRTRATPPPVVRGVQGALTRSRIVHHVTGLSLKQVVVDDRDVSVLYSTRMCD